MKSSDRYIVVLWAALVLAAAALLATRLVVVNDLTLFLPQERSDAQRFLVQQLRRGAGSNLIIAALSGAPAPQLADASRQVAARLGDDARFLRVVNGPMVPGVDKSSRLYAYRYLLSPAVTADRFSVDGLRQQLRERLVELASPVGMVTKRFLADDPVAAFSTWLRHLPQPAGPQLRHGVWFDPSGEHALLLLETRASGFDLEAQREAIAQIRSAVADLAAPVGLQMTGSGVIGVATKQRIQTETLWLSLAATLVVVTLVLYRYRSLRGLILAALPVLSGMLAAMAVTAALYGEIHGITLAFGVTLLGVALDYPLHLLSHLQRGQTAPQTVRAIWPTLRLGVISTVAGYGAMFLSGFTGLAQLALFASAGLLAAAATVRWVLPPLVPAGYEVAVAIRQRRHGPFLNRAALVGLLAAGGIVVAATPVPLWEDGLSALSPVPEAMRRDDAQLRRWSGAANAGHLLLLPGADTETVLRHCEALRPALAKQVEQGAIGGYEAPCDLLPSGELQARRQAALPDETELRQRLDSALQGLPFKSRYFEPFIRDVAASRQLLPLGVDEMADTLLGPALAGLLQHDRGQAAGIVRLAGVVDTAALQAWAAGQPSVSYLPLRPLTESLMHAFRSEMLAWLGLGLVAILVLLRLGLGSLDAALRTLLPVVAAMVLTVAALQVMGISLSLFHLVALLLVAGIGMDYALFFRRAAIAGDDARTGHALAVCALSTSAVFGILAYSAVPVLHAIGVCVALGVASSYVIARYSGYAGGDRTGRSAAQRA